tara:strand:- start:185 stop:466 length:282 start_codon:yes stop_codon:yes gene_type:complete
MSRYDTTKIIKIKEESRSGQGLGTSYLPKFEENNSDVLLISTYGDRCDLLANQYYGDSSLWWYIACVNNLKSNNIEAGIQLRIPISIEQAKIT